MAHDRVEMVSKLERFVCDELLLKHGHTLDVNEPLITSGLMDSFSIARIAVFIEETFDVYVPDPELTVENMDTLAKMADVISRYLG